MFLDRHLEQGIGTPPLFVRPGRGIVLTAVGRCCATVREICAAADAILREIHDFAEGSAGHVRIGIGAIPAQEILPAIAADLLAEMPKVTLEVVIEINNVMRDALRSSELDLVIGPVKGRDDTEFVTHILLDDEVVVSACKDRPLLKRAVTLKEMGRYHWILPARPATQRQRLDDTFIAHRLPPPEVQIQTNSLYLLPDLIVRTHLLSFTPRRHLWPQRSYAALREVGLAATTMTRNFGVMYREHAYLSPAAHRVVAPFLAE